MRNPARGVQDARAALRKLGHTSSPPEPRQRYNVRSKVRGRQVRQDLQKLADWIWWELSEKDVVPTRLDEPPDPQGDRHKP